MVVEDLSLSLCGGKEKLFWRGREREREEEL